MGVVKVIAPISIINFCNKLISDYCSETRCTHILLKHWYRCFFILQNFNFLANVPTIIVAYFIVLQCILSEIVTIMIQSI